MLRKILFWFSLAVFLTVVAGVIGSSLRNRVEMIEQIPIDWAPYWLNREPKEHADRILIADSMQNRLQIVGSQLTTLETIPLPMSITVLRATDNLSKAFVLDSLNREFCLVDLKSKSIQPYKLEKYSTEGFLSPDGKLLWISEYQSGIIHQYSLNDLEAVHSAEFNIKALASTILGPLQLIGSHDFRIVAILSHSTMLYLHSDAYNAVIVFDWSAQQVAGKIDLPDMSSLPVYSQSPSGKQLLILSNFLVVVDLQNQVVTMQKQLDGHSRAGGFNPTEDRVFVAYSAPAMLPIPFLHRGGQIDEFDLQGKCVKTWHSDASRIWHLSMAGRNPWMISDEGKLQTIRLP